MDGPSPMLCDGWNRARSPVTLKRKFEPENRPKHLPKLVDFQGVFYLGNVFVSHRLNLPRECLIGMKFHQLDD